MKDEDWDVLGSYIRTTADALGLRDWFILLKHEPPEEDDVLGQVSCVYGRKYAVIRVCLEFRELTKEEQREVIVHELVHCHHATLGHVIGRVLKKTMGDMGDTLMIPVKAEFEHLVDAIAMQWRGAFPFIEWTTTDPTPQTNIHAPWEGPIDDPSPAGGDGS